MPWACAPRAGTVKVGGKIAAARLLRLATKEPDDDADISSLEIGAAVRPGRSLLNLRGELQKRRLIAIAAHEVRTDPQTRVVPM